MSNPFVDQATIVRIIDKRPNGQVNKPRKRPAPVIISKKLANPCCQNSSLRLPILPNAAKIQKIPRKRRSGVDQSTLPNLEMLPLKDYDHPLF